MKFRYALPVFLLGMIAGALITALLANHALREMGKMATATARMPMCVAPPPPPPPPPYTGAPPWTPPATHWEKTYDGIEHYNRCVDDATGRLIIETMKSDSVSDFASVFEHGANYGEFKTTEEAKKAAAKRHPECKVQ